MPKISCLLLFVAAASLATVSAITAEEKAALQAHVAPVIAECSSEHGVSQGEIDSAAAARNVDGVKPCFYVCLLKKMNVMNDKGIYEPESAFDTVRKLIKGDEDYNRYIAAATTCKKVNDEPVGDSDAGCERAKLVLSCALQQNIELPL